MNRQSSNSIDIRVPYAHVDQMGVVYYAHYLVYFEMARAEAIRNAGMPYGEMERRGILLPAVEAHCVYRKPARYDELLRVRISAMSIRGARIRMEYEITRGDDLLATGYTDHVCMSPQGKVLRPSAELAVLVESARKADDAARPI